jgi:intracellular septation protein
MKFLFDFFPIIVFYAAYKLSGDDIFTATGAAIVATFLQVGYSYWKFRRVERMHVITALLLLVFGGLTIALHDPAFIKWKVSVVNWLFGLVFLGSHFVGDKTIMERMMSANVTVPKPVWFRLNMSWVVFFIAIGFLNLYVFKHYTENTWVNFKMYGMMGLTVVLVIGQAFYLARHMKPEEQPEDSVEGEQ